MTNSPSVASVCFCIIAVCFAILLYVYFVQRETMRKNKFKYDLRQIRFEVEPLGNDTWRLNFYCGELLHSEVVSETDVFNDRGYFFKAFVKWAEEESK